MANLARPEGEVAHAVVVVAEGVVQGASAVAEGVAMAMAACHGEDYIPMEQAQANFPPPHTVSCLLSVSLLPTNCDHISVMI